MVSKFAGENQLSGPAVCSGIAAKQFLWPAAKALNILFPVDISRQNQTRRVAFYDFIHHFAAKQKKCAVCDLIANDLKGLCDVGCS